MHPAPPELFRHARTLGLTIEPRGDRLAVRPADKCPPDLAGLLREAKVVMLEWLTATPCPGWRAVPPADLALTSAPPRRAPLFADYLARQGGDRPGALRDWLAAREAAHVAAHGWPVEVARLAAVRDAACWQLGRDEAAAADLLETLTQAVDKFPPLKLPSEIAAAGRALASS